LGVNIKIDWRTLGHRVTGKVDMEQLVAGDATRLGEKLRRHNLTTDKASVFVRQPLNP
jgi:DNA polymerase V